MHQITELKHHDNFLRHFNKWKAFFFLSTLRCINKIITENIWKTSLLFLLYVNRICGDVNYIALSRPKEIYI